MSEGAQVKNAADQKQVKNASLSAKRIRENELSDVLWILSDIRGRRFLWRLLGMCGVFKLSFTGNSQTFFNEGQRDIGLKVTADIMETRPEAYVEMMVEDKKNQEVKNEIERTQNARTD